MYNSIVEQLNSYLAARRAVERSSRRIRLLLERQSSMQVNLDGLPKSTVTRTLADYMCELEDLEEDLAEAEHWAHQAYTRVTDTINSLDDELQKDVLDLRYVVGLTWANVASELHYSKSHVQYIHRQAIDRLNTQQCSEA